VHDAINQVKFFLSLQRPFYGEPGFAPLYYFTHKSGAQGVSVSKSAVSAVSEGVGAVILQRLMHARILCRPYHDFPDAIGTDAPFGSQIKHSRLYLLEVKGTCMPAILSMTNCCAIPEKTSMVRAFE